jgi:branched-chain amino acid transport system substrate-binding protein
MITRRQFARGAAATVALPALVGRALASDEIRLVTLGDLTGGLDIYGKPVHMSLQMAVDEINESGGLNGKMIKLISYDTQSNMQLYAQYGQQAALQDQAHMVHSGITSASREILRPILKRYNTLYFYSCQYEGGVCDKNTYCTGVTPAMQGQEPIKWAVNKFGKKFFNIGADYNAPRITADWTIKFGTEAGGESVGNEFMPLEATEFGPLITKIQAANPDFVSSCLVGAAHVGFYRQWAAAGMLDKIPLFSYTFGAGNEHQLIPAEESEGIYAGFAYFQDIDNPTNKEWVKRYQAKFGADAIMQNNISIGGYDSIMVWANAVRNAGTEAREEVIKYLETSPSVTGPSGTLKMIPELNHCSRDISLGQVKNGVWNIVEVWKDQYPSDTMGQCDLIKDPTTNVQFVPG